MEQPSGNKGHLGSKFEDFEFAPRGDVWDRIESGAGGSDAPGAIASVFAGFEHAPKGRVWDRIVREMYPFRRRRAIVWWSVAAGVALVAAIVLSRPFGPEEMGLGQLARTETRGFEELGKFDQNKTDLLAQEKVEQKGGAVVAQDNGGSVDFQRGNGYAVVEKSEVDRGELRRLPNRSGMRVEKRPLELVAFEGERAERGVEIDWEAVMASDTMGLEGMAEVDDSTENDLPYFDEFNFQDDEEVRYAQLESQLGSNIAPGRSTNSYAEGSYEYGADPSLNQQLASADFYTLEPYAAESFNTPISIGGGISKRIKRRLSLGAGFVYTLMTSTTRYVNEDWETRNNIRRQYLGPTINLTHEFVQRKRISMFSIAGLQYDFPVGGKVTSVDYNAGERVGETQSKFNAGRQAGAMAGLGMNYHLTSKLRLYFQGTANHYFKQTRYNLWSTQGLWPNVQAGIRLGLRLNQNSEPVSRQLHTGGIFFACSPTIQPCPASYYQTLQKT